MPPFASFFRARKRSISDRAREQIPLRLGVEEGFRAVFAGHKPVRWVKGETTYVLARVPSIFSLVNQGGMYGVASRGGGDSDLSRSEFAECPTSGSATRSRDARYKIQPQIQREKVLSLGRFRGRRT